MVVMARPEHWEPPDPPKLLVSARRVARELGIQIWKAQQLCYGLGRIYYAPEGRNYRVTWRSVLRFRFLTEAVGLSFSDAQAVMCQETHSGSLSDEYSPPDEPYSPNPFARSRRSQVYHDSRRRRGLI